MTHDIFVGESCECRQNKGREMSSKMTWLRKFTWRKVQPAYLYYSTDQVPEATLDYRAATTTKTALLWNLIQVLHVFPPELTTLVSSFHPHTNLLNLFVFVFVHMVAFCSISYRFLSSVSVRLCTRFAVRAPCTCQLFAPSHTNLLHLLPFAL